MVLRELPHTCCSCHGAMWGCDGGWCAAVLQCPCACVGRMTSTASASISASSPSPSSLFASPSHRASAADFLLSLSLSLSPRRRPPLFYPSLLLPSASAEPGDAVSFLRSIHTSSPHTTQPAYHLQHLRAFYTQRTAALARPPSSRRAHAAAQPAQAQHGSIDNGGEAEVGWQSTACAPPSSAFSSFSASPQPPPPSTAPTWPSTAATTNSSASAAVWEAGLHLSPLPSASSCSFAAADAASLLSAFSSARSAVSPASLSSPLPSSSPAAAAASALLPRAAAALSWSPLPSSSASPELLFSRTLSAPSPVRTPSQAEDGGPTEGARREGGLDGEGCEQLQLLSTAELSLASPRSRAAMSLPPRFVLPLQPPTQEEAAAAVGPPAAGSGAGSAAAAAPMMGSAPSASSSPVDGSASALRRARTFPAGGALSSLPSLGPSMAHPPVHFPPVASAEGGAAALDATPFAELLSAPLSSASLLPFPPEHPTGLGSRSATSSSQLPQQEHSAAAPLPHTIAAHAPPPIVIASLHLAESSEQWERDAVRRQTAAGHSSHPPSLPPLTPPRARLCAAAPSAAESRPSPRPCVARLQQGQYPTVWQSSPGAIAAGPLGRSHSSAAAALSAHPPPPSMLLSAGLRAAAVVCAAALHQRSAR